MDLRSFYDGVVLWFGVAERWRASTWRDPLAKYMNMIHNKDKELKILI